jgi:hypothetical protein
MGLIQGLINIIWPSHLFIPKNATRFKRHDSGTTGLWTFGPPSLVVPELIIPDKHIGIIQWAYFNGGEQFVWKLKINNQPDIELGSIDGTHDPMVDQWQSTRVMLKAQDKVTVSLVSPNALAGAVYYFTIRGYYWPE